MSIQDLLNYNTSKKLLSLSLVLVMLVGSTPLGLFANADSELVSEVHASGYTRFLIITFNDLIFFDGIDTDGFSLLVNGESKTFNRIDKTSYSGNPHVTLKAAANYFKTENSITVTYDGASENLWDKNGNFIDSFTITKDANSDEYVGYFDIPPFSYSQKLLASDGQDTDHFGYSVAIDGTTAIVGAFSDDNGVWAGAVYIFEYDGNNWNETTKLLASDGQAYDQFGFSVAIDGTTAIVGAYGDNDNGLNVGSAYIFEYDGNNWVETKLLASDGQFEDYFGFSVAIDGTTAIVGSYYDDDNGDKSGSAYIFEYDGNNWVETKILANDGQNGDWFGSSVAIDGTTVIIGAYGDNDNGSYSGSAYIYKYDGISWNETTKLLASDGQNGDWFGYSVAIDGTTAIVGAMQTDGNEFVSGSAYIYKYDGISWNETTKLLASDGQYVDRFGHSVAIDGTTVIIGAERDDDNGGNSGSAYIFEYDGNNWVETKLLPSDGQASDSFGHSVAIDDTTVIIGAHYDDDNGDRSGSVYVFSR